MHKNSRMSWDNKTEDTITEEELDWVINDIAVGKVAGHASIAPEMIKFRGRNAKELLLSIIRESYKCKIIPKDWELAVTLHIYKTVCTTLCENYRGESLLSVPEKIYERIL